MRAFPRGTSVLIATILILPSALAPAATKTAKFNVTATVQSDCTISATAMAFGTVGLLASNVDNQSTITVTCTPTTPYVIALNAGDVPGSTVDARLMSSGTSSMMFQLYRDAARIQVWGETSGVNTFGDTGTGIPVPITVYGRVPPQTAPTAGSYLAQITATITY